MKQWSSYPVRFLLMAVCERPETLTSEQRSEAGVVARRLLEYANDATPRQTALVRSGIEFVCRTYDSDPGASKALLSQCFRPGHIESYGYEEIPILARETGRLIRIAPEFVRDVYVAAFGFKEERTDQISMGPGRILSLMTNRRQDYQSAYWQLGQIFPAYLKVAPEFAIESLVAVVAEYCEDRALGSDLKKPTGKFSFCGIGAEIQADTSHVWDANAQHHDAHEAMLDALQKELLDCANDASALKRLIAAVAKYNKWAAIWRRLLICGTNQPSTIGLEVLDLATALPVACCLDTSNLVGHFIKAMYPLINVGQRQKIEQTIWQLPAAFPSEKREAAEIMRDRLLGCIPDALIVTPEVKQRIDYLVSHGGLPGNPPPFHVFSSGFSKITETEILEEQGVPVRETANQNIQGLVNQLHAFEQSHTNKPPTLPEIEEVILKIHGLHKALTAKDSGVHQIQNESGWSHLMRKCALIAHSEELDCTTENGRIIRALLLEGAEHPVPAYHESQEERFDDMPSWSPGARIDAADGLMLLSRKPSCADAVLLEKIKKLSTDPVAAVRMHIAQRLGCMEKTYPDQMLGILEAMARQDASSAVVESLLSRVLNPLVWQNPAKVAELTEFVYSRTDLRGEVAENVRAWCVSIFLTLFLWQDHEDSEKRITKICSDVVTFTHEASTIVNSLREILVTGSVEKPEPKPEAARKRSFAIFEHIVKSISTGYAALQKKNGGKSFSEWPEIDQKKARDVMQLADAISMQLFFASGSFTQKQGANQSSETPPSIDARRRFLSESNQLFDLLINLPHPSIIHHLVETLEFLLEIDPRSVFLKLVAVVKAGTAGGYQNESLGTELIVRITNRVFADYRPLLQDHKDMREAMVDLLDIFVDAGWPQAIQLTYRLDEIFR